MNNKTRKLTSTAMLVAIAFAATFAFRVPIFPAADFLKYEPKDIIITIGGLIWGPFTVILVSISVSFIELITISQTGIIGFIMNVLASCAFACPVAIIYKKRRTLFAAIVGLLVGIIAMSIIMLLWNYLITPIFMNVPREVVSGMLLPIILPFNILKASLNAAFTMLLYKPIINALKKANLLNNENIQEISKRNLGSLLVSLLVIVTGVLVVLSLNGII